MLKKTAEDRLRLLRDELDRRGLDGFVVPISDEHMSEYVGSYAQRLAWISGFGGSAGSALVMRDRAVMFVDGRYTVQVRDQVDPAHWEYENVPATSIPQWLAANAPEGARVGYDAWLHDAGFVADARAALEKRGGTLVAVDGNPIDAVWNDQPAPSPAQAVPYETDLAGQSSAQKRAQIAEWLKSEGLDATVIAALDSVAWLLNIRGADVDHTPVALSYVLAHADGTADFFIAPEKVSPDLAQHLGNAVRIRDRGEFEGVLAQMEGKRVGLDPERSVAAIGQALEGAGATIVARRDPTILPKARKNEAEKAGQRSAQEIDAVAVTKFLHWLSVEGPTGTLDELGAAARLHAFRKECGDLRDASFDTISAAAGHAALPHYKVDEDSNIAIPPSSVFLCDSGGQYPQGTTDITRTVWIGPGDPPAEVRRRFTQVLKGHIALARQVFPDGTQGAQLDALARQFLWMDGVDYGHGTGHGVGSYLAVHEGPQRISKPGGGQAGTSEPLRSGMICSNEPGYYKPGEYGIRIENLVIINDATINGMEGDYLEFETVTFVPITRDLIDRSLLSADEIAWLDSYHKRCREILEPVLEGDVKAWMLDNTASL
jgi:Xaa-Pro aminopeptidase